MKSQLQKRVRYNRCQVKHECYEVSKNTPEAEREALWRTPAFSWIDKDSWATLCTYYDSEGKKEEARRNEQNQVSNLHGRATYTGGSRNMCRAMEQLKCQIIEDGGTPTMLKLYLGTHSSSVDKISGEYTYPDNSTNEYCEQVIEKATSSGVNSTPEDDAFSFTPEVDSTSSGVDAELIIFIGSLYLNCI
ncbi:uncharacterized protein LOC109824328 isoform X1 [Asparagus officinalis]|uniref:uncharacterized protein LOC109824328 isoform X1 n=1 Tax=Asparagus officinalis TaxID=4686 RepID=UPI00098E0DC4|nr:uncharacterized protein LOC109824328 isoform X1 [Asparagus officinalis]